MFELEGTLTVFTLGLSYIPIRFCLAERIFGILLFLGGLEQHKPETSEGIVSTFKEV